MPWRYTRVDKIPLVVGMRRVAAGELLDCASVGKECGLDLSECLVTANACFVLSLLGATPW